MVLGLALFVACLPFARASCGAPTHPHGILDQLHLSGYKKKSSPFFFNYLDEYQYEAATSGTASQVSVKFWTVITALHGVDAKNQQVEVEAELWYVWKDERLKWDTTCWPGATSEYYDWFYYSDDDTAMAMFGQSPTSELWTPTVVIENQIEAHILTEFFGINSKGMVLWRREEKLKISCIMDFSDLPYDDHLCAIKVKTPMEPYSQVAVHAWGRALDVDLGQGTIKGWEVSPRDLTSDSGEGHSHLDVPFVIQREPEFYVHTVMIPTAFIVAMAYLSFWISRQAVPARVALVVIGFLVIMAKLSSVQEDLPETSDHVWLVTFMQISMYFVFIASAEYAMANTLSRIEARVKKARESLDADADVVDADVLVDVGTKEPTRRERMRGRVGRMDMCLLTKDGRMLMKDEFCDIFMRYLFPVAYLATVGYLYTQL